MSEHYNPGIGPLLKIIDKDNGEGYAKNIKTKNGMIIKLPKGNTRMLYEIKHVNEVRIVFIRYIHYDSVKELYQLLAFAAKWWVRMNPHMIYYREKDRQNRVGKILKDKMGFSESTVANDLKPFKCLKDNGNPCKCNIYECIAYKPSR